MYDGENNTVSTERETQPEHQKWNKILSVNLFFESI